MRLRVKNLLQFFPILFWRVPL